MLSRVENPPNPWVDRSVEYLGEPPRQRLQVYEDASESILSENESPDVGFRWSVNPYRGCHSGCAYCYARPTHEYLGWGAGTDFERKIVVKPEAPRLLREAFARDSWEGELVAFSGVTDCYQPLEASYELTRGCLEVCRAHRQPVAVVTKWPIVERDVDLLAALHEEAHCVVHLSLAFLDPEPCRAVEPSTPLPARRLETIRRLADAGVPVGLLCAPIIPALNDAEIPDLLEAAREAGARWATRILLRLPGSVEAVFERRIRETLPDRADRILSQVEACRGGRRNDPRFGARMRGHGPRWEAIDRLFQVTARRLGFGSPPPEPDPSPFRRRGQRRLFG